MWYIYIGVYVGMDVYIVYLGMDAYIGYIYGIKGNPYLHGVPFIPLMSHISNCLSMCVYYICVYVGMDVCIYRLHLRNKGQAIYTCIALYSVNVKYINLSNLCVSICIYIAVYVEMDAYIYIYIYI
jgi:hypothetical protein